MVKISIIMPVYNCEEFLNESINSVMKQSITEWELLCIDDGSTDSSLQILHEFESKEPRIRVYTQENQGAGAARNLGLQYAVGEYIAFLDADDFFIEKDALQDMYDACKQNGVKACGTNLFLLREGQIKAGIIFKDIQDRENSSQVFRYIDFQFDYGYYCFIYEAAFLQSQNIKFPAYKRFQDPPFFTKALYAIDEFCFINKALYCYRTPNLVKRLGKDKIEGLLAGLYDNLQFAKEHKLTILFDKTVKRMEEEYGDIICHSLRENSVEAFKQLLDFNDLVQEVYGQAYVISPLRKILGSIQQVEAAKKESFLGKLAAAEQIYIYGAGKMTKDFLSILKARELVQKVKGILVTEKEHNPEMVEDISVLAINEYTYIAGDLVVIAVSGIYLEDIISELKKRKVAVYEKLEIGIFEAT